MIRTAWVAFAGVVVTLFFGPLVILGSLVHVRGRLYDWAGRSWSRSLLWASAVKVRALGLEHLHADSSQVLVGNHASHFDVLAVSSLLDRPFHFVAKKELEGVPIFGRAWKAAGHISIDRSDRDRAIASLNRAADRLRREAEAVVIFPEGTRSPDGHLQPFKKGAFMLALKAGVELVPFAVSGSRRILPKGSWRVRPGTITVRFGEPVPTAGRTEDDRDRLIAEVRSRIETMLSEAASPAS